MKSSARCRIKVSEKTNKVLVKGCAETDDQWLTMAAAMISAILDHTAEDVRKKYLAAIVFTVKNMVFGEEKDGDPGDG